MTETGEKEKGLADQLKQLLSSLETGGRAVLPRSNDALLKSIVEAAARIFNAAAASILLVNEQEQVLVFKVAYGAANRDLVGMKFPLNQGIAGYVVMTGQPLTVSNVRTDPRFNQDFARSTGYVPNSILAAPLLAGDRVIGVMEVLDKINAASFGMQDMELLAMFARQAAIAIDQSQRMEIVDGALAEGLKRLIEPESAAQNEALLKALEQAGSSPTSADLLALADLFNDISALGEPERKACIQILKTFAEYQRASRRARL